MALAANPFDDEPIERRPGDFYRSKAGTPYVSDPSGALVKSGPRKGEPKRLASNLNNALRELPVRLR